MGILRFTRYHAAPIEALPQVSRPNPYRLTARFRALRKFLDVSLPSTVLWLLFRCLYSRPVHVCEDSPAKTIRGLMHNILNLI